MPGSFFMGQCIARNKNKCNFDRRVVKLPPEKKITK